MSAMIGLVVHPRGARSNLGGRGVWRHALSGCVVALLLAASNVVGAISLGADIVVDPSGQTLYVVDPAGYTQAVAVDDGRLYWASTEQATPIAMVGGRLLALGMPPQRGMGMLMMINPASGVTVDRVAFDVPEDVIASAALRPMRRFRLQVESGTDGLRLHWQSTGRPMRGALIDADGDGDLSEDSLAQVESGAFDIVTEGQRTLAIPVRNASEPTAPSGVALSVEESLQGIDGRQFRAADDAYVLASVATPDADFATAYRWSIHARDDGRFLGRLDSPYSYAPFMVRGSLMVYRAEPTLVLQGDKYVGQPSRLVAFDLATGAERWSVPVREAEYRGPVPP